MKKNVFLIFFLAALPFSVNAQPDRNGKVEVSANISGDVADTMFGNYDFYYNSMDLASIYEPRTRNVNYTPVFSVMGEYKLRKDFSVGLEAAWWHMSKEYYDSFTDDFTGSCSRHSVSLMPCVKYRYLIRRSFELHSGAAVGAGLMFGKDGNDSTSEMQAAYQFLPIGMRIGRDIYATLDYYMGNVAFGVRFGIGYRF